MIGKRVRYRGSLQDCWGDYIVIGESVTPEGPRYELGDRNRQLVLSQVRPQSLTVQSDRLKHQVVNLALRVLIAQREIAATIPREDRLPQFWDWIDHLRTRLQCLIEDHRPAEAEYWLIQAERTAGCIDQATLQRHVSTIAIGGDDESWMA